MTNNIFRRYFIIYACIVLIAGLVTEIYIASAVRENHVENLRQHLLDEINLLSGSVSFDKSNNDNFCVRTKEKIHARVTIVLNDGTVTGDSDHESSTMDNHSNRTEIMQAATLGTGMTIRYSDTLKYDFLYVATKITADGKDVGFIRLAVPLLAVDRSVNMLRAKILLVVMVVLLVTWGVSVWQTNHLRRLLHQITGFSRSLSRGELDKRLFLNKAGEFNEIADNLTSMSVSLQNVITKNEEEKNRLNVILKSVPDALLIIDAKGMITLSSSSAGEFFGDAGNDKREDILLSGRSCSEVVRNHEFAELIEEVRRDRAPGMTEMTIDTPSEKYLKVRVSPLYYKGDELAGFVAVFHDITEIKKLEQVRKDFVANVSHELKTPITAIMGFADTLLDGALADRENAARFVQTIKSNSERINELVVDLMTISRIELGVIKIEKSLTDIGGVFENVTELFRAKANEKKLSLGTKLDSGPQQIEADRNRLIQILTNFVDNAIKYTETGSVTLGAATDTDGRAFLFVEDTGIGVPAKFVDRLGERFFRVDPARSRKMGGTGLGLAIVKHLVKAHGWNMRIESFQGKGTRVKIYI